MENDDLEMSIDVIETLREAKSGGNGSETDVSSNMSPDISPTASTENQPPSVGSTICSTIKSVCSATLLLFCIVIVAAAIFQKQTTATAEYNLHPIVAFIIFWILLLWLALMEGSLNVMVGLKPVDKNLYSETHRLAHTSTKLIHKEDNLERFIVGRQYLDLMCVFLTSFMVSSIDDASVLGLPQHVTSIFLSSGFAVILITIVIGQLVAQINSSSCMLDFINNYAVVVTSYLALTVEASGILHAVYFIQIVVTKLAGFESNDAPHNTSIWKRILFWVQIAFSVILLSGALVIMFTALFAGSTTMWEGVPAYASILILVSLVIFVGIMEGLQIAFMAVMHMGDNKVLQQNAVVKSNCDLVFGQNNLQAFLIGRQIFQTIVMFVIARITTLDVDPSGENIFGVNDSVQKVLNTGVLGALISTIVASLSWRVLANSFPLAFLANPLAGPTIRLCLIIEGTGICSIAWLLAAGHRRIAGLKEDTVYLGKNHSTGSIDNTITTQDLNARDPPV